MMRLDKPSSLRNHTLMLLALGATTASCGYERWPEPTEVYPYVYTPEADLENYEHVRWETETWDPATDLDQVALYLLKAENHRPGAPAESLAHFEQMRAQLPPLGSGIELAFVGDVMWVGSNWSAFADPAASLLAADLRAGNLETPTSPAYSTEPGDLGLYAFNAPPEILDGLPLDVLQLNNNHSLDAGNDGLEDTLDAVLARGHTPVGVDTHATVSVGGRTLAFLSYTWGLNIRDVKPQQDLFVVPFGHLDAPLDLSRVVREIREAREQSDAVIVMLHWGFEYEYYPDPHFMRIARELVAAGADILVGSGPHVLQPPELCHVNRPAEVPGIGSCSVRSDEGESRTAAILYSLGNFGTRMPTIPAQVGGVVTVSLDPDVTGLAWSGVATIDGPDGKEIQPLERLIDHPDYAAEALRLEAHLGTGWKRP